MDRRQFCTWTVGGAFLLGLHARAAEPGASAASADLTPWIRIGPDGRVTLVSTVSDMGQGSRTGQVQLLADELEVDMAEVAVEMAPDRAPFLDEGSLFTGGSRSVRTRYDVLRKAGATARAQLRTAAARRWKVSEADCEARLGRIRHVPSGRSLGYGELAGEAAALPPPSDPPLKPRETLRLVGRPIPMLGAEEKVDGRAVYGVDVRRPGMLYASLRQSPRYGARLVSVDEAPARAIAGVVKVVRLDRAVAVIARDSWTAIKAVRALEPKWSDEGSDFTTEGLAGRLRAAFDAPGAVVSPEKDGAALRASLRAGYASADRRLEATYELPLLSHCPLEPMNATAQVTADRVEVWAPMQQQSDARADLARALGRSPDQIVLHTTLIGGGFGRRLQTDYMVLAGLVAREADVPVQLLWTREEDFAHDVYRPASLIRYRAVLAADGLIQGLEAVGATTDDTAFGGSGPRPYAIDRFAATQTRIAANVPIGAWRSVDASITVFAKECFIDECAYAAGEDPLAYRRRLLGSNARALRVLDAAAEAIGWSAPRAPGVGRGLAMMDGWDTLVAHAVEVQVDGDRVRVTRLVAAADPGLVVNPQLAHAQLEGGGLMALSAAMGETMGFSGGAARDLNFDGYSLLRMRQAPQVETLLLESPGAPVGGLGEPPVPGVAPALFNAVFAATGRRLRQAPLRGAGLSV